MLNAGLAISYFGGEAVERAIADHFARNGLTEQVRDDLIEMSEQDAEGFFDLVSNFLENAAA
jgi:hypothetical protein